MRVKSFGSLCIGIILVISNTVMYAANAGYVKYSIVERTLPLMIIGEGGSNANLDYSSIVAISSTPTEYKNSITGKVGQITYTNVIASCSSIDDPLCQNNRYSGYLFLGNCLSSSPTACVKNVEFKGENLNFHSYTNSKVFSGNSQLGFPEGRAASIWKSISGRYFALAPVIRVMGAGTDFQFKSFSVLLEEVEFTNSPYKRAKPSYLVNQVGTSEMHAGSPSDNLCYESGESGLCIKRLITLKGEGAVTLHLTRNSPKWLTGRLANFSSSINTPPEGGFDLTLRGTAQTVPALSIKVEGEEYANYLKGMGATIGPETNLDFVSNNHDAKNAIQQLIKYEEPSTLYSKDYWLVNGSLQNDMGDCFSSANQIAGFVMTNAAIYPALNPVVFNGDFEFQIISPHTDEKGNVNTGSYDMSMSTNLVRCLYRLGSNPYKASVSVLNIDGTQKVATTTVAERNGSLVVTARNFTFSSPRIVVKVIPEQIKAYTIKCVKGNIVKTVKGTKPKCPAGYKAK